MAIILAERDHERAELLRAIAAVPSDDVPRLVYADLLDRAGDQDSCDRARFVRLQVRLHRGERLADRDLASMLWLRQHQVPRWQQREVSGLFSSLDFRDAPPARYSAQWGRGFVGAMTLAGEDYLPCAIKLHSWLPLEKLDLNLHSTPREWLDPIVSMLDAHRDRLRSVAFLCQAAVANAVEARPGFARVAEAIDVSFRHS